MPQPKKHQTSAERQAAYRLRTARAHTEQLTKRSLPPLPAIPTMPGEARWSASLRQALWLVERTATEMQEYHDERSEEWQESERGWSFVERIEALQETLSSLEEQTA